MKTIRNQILELLNKSCIICHSAGSCGELGDSFQAIDGEDISTITDEIINLIQAVFDPENQPNQFGIKNPFELDKSDFDKAVEPAIRYLLKNHNPHTKIHIDYSNAELLEGQRTHNLNNEIPD